jgi:hypothetical protein
VVNHFIFGVGSYDLKSVSNTGTSVITEYRDVGVEGVAGSNDVFVTGTTSSKTSTNDGGTVLTLPSGEPTIAGTTVGPATIDKLTRIVNNG